jgi:hypothetical protein
MPTVKYEDLWTAYEFVSASPQWEHSAFISLETGDIYWDTDEEAGERELPDDLDDGSRYLAVPHKNDLDLGRDLVFRFVTAELPDHDERVRSYFHHRGAYSRLKELLAAAGKLEAWYAFQEEETKTALRAWCREHDIEVADDRPGATRS